MNADNSRIDADGCMVSPNYAKLDAKPRLKNNPRLSATNNPYIN